MQSTVEQDVRRKTFSITASDVQPYPEVWVFWSVCRTSGRCQRTAHPAAALRWAHWTCHEPLPSHRYSSELHIHSHSQIFHSARVDSCQSSVCQAQAKEPYTHPEAIVSIQTVACAPCDAQDVSTEDSPGRNVGFTYLSLQNNPSGR